MDICIEVSDFMSMRPEVEDKTYKLQCGIMFFQALVHLHVTGQDQIVNLHRADMGPFVSIHLK